MKKSLFYVLTILCLTIVLSTSTIFATDADDSIAKVGGKFYTSLEEAILASSEENPCQILKNLELDYDICISDEGTHYIDMDGHTITFDTDCNALQILQYGGGFVKIFGGGAIKSKNTEEYYTTLYIETDHAETYFIVDDVDIDRVSICSMDSPAYTYAKFYGDVEMDSLYVSQCTIDNYGKLSVKENTGFDVLNNHKSGNMVLAGGIGNDWVWEYTIIENDGIIELDGDIHAGITNNFKMYLDDNAIINSNATITNNDGAVLFHKNATIGTDKIVGTGEVVFTGLNYEFSDEYTKGRDVNYDLNDGELEGNVLKVLFPGDTIHFTREDTPAVSDTPYIVGVNMAVIPLEVSSATLIEEEDKDLGTTYESFTIDENLGRPVALEIDFNNYNTQLYSTSTDKRAAVVHLKPLNKAIDTYVEATYTGIEGIIDAEKNPIRFSIPRIGSTYNINLNCIKEGENFDAWIVTNQGEGDVKVNSSDFTFDTFTSKKVNLAPAYKDNEASGWNYGTIILNAKNGLIDNETSKEFEIKFDSLEEFDLENYVAVLDGYVFKGWFTTSELTTEVKSLTEVSDVFYGSSNIDTRKLTLYAKLVPTYKVTFDQQEPTTLGESSVVATFECDMPTLKTLPQKDGYNFAGYFTEENGGGIKYYNNDGTSAKVYDVSDNMTLYACWNKITSSSYQTYKVLEGADQEWTKGEKTDITIVVNAKNRTFRAIRIDDEKIDEDCYTITEDSTTITLKSSYLETLTEEEHKIVIQYMTGKAKTSFTINENVWVNIFEDVNEKEDWFYDDVKYVNENGIMNGTDKTIFAPQQNVTRAMVIMTLWNIENSPVVNYAMNFKDVEEDMWYTEAIRWAVSERIAEGYDNGNFGVNDNATREQLATMLYRYVKKNGKGFTDAWTFLLDMEDRNEISDWAYESICWMNMNGVINGRPNKIFDPKGNAVRCELAKMLHNLQEI